MESRALASSKFEDPRPQRAADKTNGKHPASESKNNGARPAFESLFRNELVWQPYRVMSRVLLLTHKNLSAYMTANRSLTSEIESILTRAEDIALKISEKTVALMSSTSGQTIPGDELEKMYDLAADGIRELGEATVAAQIRSIEILRDHARATVDRAKTFKSEFARN